MAKGPDALTDELPPGDSTENVQKRLAFYGGLGRDGHKYPNLNAAVQACRIWIEAEKLKLAAHGFKEAEAINKRLAARVRRLEAELSKRGIHIAAA